MTQGSYLPSYVALLLPANGYAPGAPIGLFTASELTSWHNTPGNGVLFGIVSYTANPNFGASGVTVTATGDPSGNNYPVYYNAPGQTMTDATGYYKVFNVAPGDTVTVNASRSGFTFSAAAGLPTQSDGPTLLLYPGSAKAYVRGYVRNKTTGVSISGALVSLTDSSNKAAGSVYSGQDGSFYLGVGALGTYSITASMSVYGPFSPQSVSFATAGQTVNAGSLSMTPGPSLSLSSGWNLISLPVQPANTAIASVLSGISGFYQVVWAYPGQAWQVYDPNDAPGSTLTTIQAGMGYWIKMTAAKTLSLSGSAPSLSLSLVSGWNLVGYNGTSCAPASTALLSLGSALQVFWGYPSQGWQFYDPTNSSSTLPQFCPGMGYWVEVNQAGTWTAPVN